MYWKNRVNNDGYENKTIIKKTRKLHNNVNSSINTSVIYGNIMNSVQYRFY